MKFNIHLYVKKKLNKLSTDGMNMPEHIKSQYNKPKTNITLNNENVQSVTSKIKSKMGLLTLTTFIHNSSVSPSQNKQAIKNKNK